MAGHPVMLAFSYVGINLICASHVCWRNDKFACAPPLARRRKGATLLVPNGVSLGVSAQALPHQHSTDRACGDIPREGEREKGGGRDILIHQRFNVIFTGQTIALFELLKCAHILENRDNYHWVHSRYNMSDATKRETRDPVKKTHEQSHALAHCMCACHKTQDCELCFTPPQHVEYRRI